MVYVFLANGFEDMEAFTPIDLLRRAGIQVTTVGVGTAMPRSSHGISVMADISEDLFLPDDDTEAVVFPGGTVGTANLKTSETVQRAARLGIGEAAEDITVAAICAAPTILAGQGLLRGKKATCYPDRAAELGDSYVDEETVFDAPYLTGRAAGAAIPFPLRLIEILRGREAADAVAEKICY